MRRLYLIRLVLLYDAPVHFPARPKRALLGLKVDMVQAKPHRIALGPFEIVQERPVMVRADIVAVPHRLGKNPKVAFEMLGS